MVEAANFVAQMEPTILTVVQMKVKGNSAVQTELIMSTAVQMEVKESTVAQMELIMLTVVTMAEKVNCFKKYSRDFERTKSFTIGKYCCTNGANNPRCDQATTRTTRATAPTTTKFKGPPYLPQPTIKTTRGPTTTDHYTYGSRPTNTYHFSWTHGLWSHEPRTRTISYGTTTTTPKYEYPDQHNGIHYAGEQDNSV